MRMNKNFGRALLLAAALALSAGSAVAQTVEGVWVREDGEARVKFSSCGAALCGVVIWVKRPEEQKHVGQQVFSGMTASGQNSWKGEAFSPKEGKTFSGTMV